MYYWKDSDNFVHDPYLSAVTMYVFEWHVDGKVNGRSIWKNFSFDSYSAYKYAKEKEQEIINNEKNRKR